MVIFFPRQALQQKNSGWKNRIEIPEFYVRSVQESDGSYGQYALAVSEREGDAEMIQSALWRDLPSLKRPRTGYFRIALGAGPVRMLNPA
ncbi:hypothetical protein [Herbaspirillum huttiense]|uniref:hypothetical protein n=1 Tax=Herbaspirillum huttiense TaxID=863372 RepID=UPI0039AF4B4E